MAEEIRKKVWINGCRTKYDGIPLVFPPNVGVSIATNVYWRQPIGYERRVWLALKPFLMTKSCFFDIGANVGLFSVLAKKLREDLEVCSFEPVPSIAEKFSKFCSANGLGNMRLERVALSDHSGHTHIALPVSHTPEEGQAATLEPVLAHCLERFRVPVQTLDDFCANSGSLPGVLKIDVEGHEMAVLRGARAVLESCRPAIVCEVLSGSPHGQQLSQFLEELRYHVFALADEGLFRLTRVPQKRALHDYAFLPSVVDDYLSYEALTHLVTTSGVA